MGFARLSLKVVCLTTRRACARLAGLGSGARCGSAAWTAVSTAAAATWPASATQVAGDRVSRVILSMMTGTPKLSVFSWT
jgi:hypothetical protein